MKIDDLHMVSNTESVTRN